MAILNSNDNLNSWIPEGIQGLAAIFVSSTIVISLFFGIKFRWFRYRMRIPSVEESPASPVLLRSNSLTDVRHNCSFGRYSYVEDDSPSPMSPVSPPPASMTASTSSVTSSSSFSVKSKNKTPESIFKWPFKSKKHQSFEIDQRERALYDNRHGAIKNARKGQDLETMEKNERIKRSIHERLYSTASMPDLIQQNEPKQKPDLKIQIHKGIEVTDDSTQFVTVDEIKIPKRPVRKVRRAPDIPSQISQSPPIETQKSEESPNDEVISPILEKPRPPTPPRRQSRSDSLRASQIEYLPQAPTLEISRKIANENYASIESFDEVPSVEEQPLKSILKTGNEEQQTPKAQRITFADVPDSPSDSETDENYVQNERSLFRSTSNESDDDVWTKIDMHRSQLQKYRSEQDRQEDSLDDEDDDDIPPPLPKTPPPIVDEPSYLREFVIA